MLSPRTPKLKELLDFAALSYAERLPLGANWHPGDIIWQLKGDWSGLSAYHAWGEPNAIRAMTAFDGPTELWLEILPGHEGLLTELLSWAEDVVRSKTSLAGASLSVRAFLEDSSRIGALEHLGYRRDRGEGVWYRHELIEPLPDFAVSGYHVIDSVGINPARRAKTHRDSWNALDHLGIAANSQFTTDTYLGLSASPLYDPTLDLLVEEEATGDLVANVCGWIDPLLSVGIFEPMGTSPHVRGKRLARLALLEGLRRMQVRGMRLGLIGTAHFNHAAQKAYIHAGFAKTDESWWWSKAL